MYLASCKNVDTECTFTDNRFNLFSGKIGNHVSINLSTCSDYSIIQLFYGNVEALTALG